MYVGTQNPECQYYSERRCQQTRHASRACTSRGYGESASGQLIPRTPAVSRTELVVVLMTSTTLRAEKLLRADREALMPPARGGKGSPSKRKLSSLSSVSSRAIAERRMQWQS